MEVINPKVLERRSEDRNEAFVPWVSSSCSLTVNEGNSLVQIHDAPTRAEYEPLLMLPIKKLTGLRTLKSIFENLEALRDQYVDTIVAVTFVCFKFRNHRRISMKFLFYIYICYKEISFPLHNFCNINIFNSNIPDRKYILRFKFLYYFLN